MDFWKWLIKTDIGTVVLIIGPMIHLILITVLLTFIQTLPMLLSVVFSWIVLIPSTKRLIYSSKHLYELKKRNNSI